MQQLTDKQKKLAWIAGAALLAIHFAPHFAPPCHQRCASCFFVRRPRRASKAVTEASDSGANAYPSAARSNCSRQVRRCVGRQRVDA